MQSWHLPLSLRILLNTSAHGERLMELLAPPPAGGVLLLTGQAPPSPGAWEVTQAVSLADPGWQTITGALAHPHTGPKPRGCPKSRGRTTPASLTRTPDPLAGPLHHQSDEMSPRAAQRRGTVCPGPGPSVQTS